MSTPIRLWRVPGMKFGMQELILGQKNMTPEVLAGISDAGFTGVWAMVRLRDVARTDIFPELGADAHTHQEILRELSDRCRDAGLNLYVHLNEPRGFPVDDPFLKAHPDVAGAPSPSPNDVMVYGWRESRAMCTSTPGTLAWLEQACTDLFTKVPDLGGTTLITTSEHTSHCYSHFDACGSGIGEHFGQKPGDVLDCPRCRDREPADILREVLVTVERGIHSASKGAHVIAWTWSWDMLTPAPQKELIESLPPGIIIMPDNERGGELEWNGRTAKVDEYSLNYIGPSPRARAQIEIARDSGKRAMIRIQINHTVESSTAPNWPIIANIYRKLANLRELGVSDAMASWCFAITPDTLNVFAFSRFLREPEWRDEDEFLETVARDYFGIEDGRAVAQTWHAFGDAIKPYPFGFGVMYFSPFNLACAYPLPNHEPRIRPMEVFCITEDGKQGDMLEQSVEPYGVAEVVERLGLVYDAWTAAVAEYQNALAVATISEHAEQELNVARYFSHICHSGWVLFSWFAWRYHRDAIPDLDKDAVRTRLEAELRNLDDVAVLLERDSRLGFYEENQEYFVTPKLVRAKRESDAALLESL